MEIFGLIVMVAFVIFIFWIPSDMAVKRGRSGWLTLLGSIVINPIAMIVIIALMGYKEQD